MYQQKLFAWLADQSTYPHCICPLLKVVFWKGINPKGPDP